MSKQWFVLNTLTGQEQKVQKLLVAKAAEAEVDLAGMIGETLMRAPDRQAMLEELRG